MKKIDCWMGRHMSARRWIVAWNIDLAASVFLAIVIKSIAAQTVMAVNAALAAFMPWGNVRRS